MTNLPSCVPGRVSCVQAVFPKQKQPTTTTKKETKTEMYLSGGVSVPCIYTHARESYHVPLVEFIYLVFAHTSGDSYRRRLRSLLLCLCDVFRALIYSLLCWLCGCSFGRSAPIKFCYSMYSYGWNGLPSSLYALVWTQCYLCRFSLGDLYQLIIISMDSYARGLLLSSSCFLVLVQF